MQQIQIKEGAKIKDYMAYGSLIHSAKELIRSANDFLKLPQSAVKRLKGHTIWMINSTAIGGGVAEMVPSQMRLIRELGLKIEWLVIEASDERFFDITKRIHNAIHGSGDGVFTVLDREVHEKENMKNLEIALSHIKDGDMVIIHDPQPMPLAAMIKAKRDVTTLWRCHIGLESQNETTKGVWQYLSRYYDAYDHFVFSLPSYVPDALRDKSSIITPAIDPLSHKNRTLQMHKCIGILHQSGIINDRKEILYPFYTHQVRRIMPDGSFGKVNAYGNLDLIYRPAVFQVSRWDRLKGFKELMDAFILMKKRNREANPQLLSTRRIKKTRLILAGPDPKFVSDDPEGKEVLDELIEQYKSIDTDLQEDIAVLLLPLDDQKRNALIVNALQYSSSIVVQNSIQEGFGLTATEAMWKKKPVLVSGAAGLRFQVQDGTTGTMNADPKNIEGLSETMEWMLNHPKERDNWGFNAQVKVIEEFTILAQVRKWLTCLAKLI